MDDHVPKIGLRGCVELDEHGRIPIEMGNREEPRHTGAERRLLGREVDDADGENGAVRGRSGPNLRTSALLNGRSQANAFPATNQVRCPCRVPS